jgi:hypothetical protein
MSADGGQSRLLRYGVMSPDAVVRSTLANDIATPA